MQAKFHETMMALSMELAGEPSWVLYAEYCRARAKDRRERSVLCAMQFAKAALEWPFEERKRFSLWSMYRAGWALERHGRSQYASRASAGGTGLIEPRTVVMTIILPTLVEWRKLEPGDAEPHFWLALYDHKKHPAPGLREAIRLDPTHGHARAALVEHIVKYIKDNQHDLPAGYHGNPADDLTDLAEASGLLTEAVEAPSRASLRKQISILGRAAQDWIKLRERLVGETDWEARRAIWQSRGA